MIPAGARQRSAPAVKRLRGPADRQRRPRDAGQGGRSPPAASSYPAGSYVIDMHQPKRGIVNSLLEPGLDITDRVDDLYAGPGGWSQALTWGATVDTLVSEIPTVETERVFAGAATRRCPTGEHRTCCSTRRTPRTCSRSTRCSAQGVKVTRLSDGSVLVPRERPRRGAGRGDQSAA